MTDPALILAAGAGTRFGGPKQLARFRGRPLVVHVGDRLREAGFEPIVLLGAHRERVEQTLPADRRRIHVPEWRAGLSATIRRGVETLLESRSAPPRRLLLAACDQPLVTSRDFRRLREACDVTDGVRVGLENGLENGPDAAAAAYDGIIGVPACFAGRHLATLTTLDGDRGAGALLRDGSLEVREVAIPAAARDIDTTADLNALCDRGHRRGGSRE